MGETAFEIRSASKFFPGVKALQEVSITLKPGSIHALLGENGAGKSTLIKLITGVHRPDGGALLVGGRPVQFHSPRDAIAAGIGVVHQERNLVPRFSIAENMALEQLAGNPLTPLDYAELNRRAEPWLRMLGLDLDPALRVSRLSVAQMQLVEIAKALSQRSRVLLLDEPTASLTPHEAQALFKVLRGLRDDGVSILFVSHKLEEVQEICDTVSVLRDGRNAGNSLSMQGLGRADLIRMMIGRDEQRLQARQAKTAGAVALELRDVSTDAGHKGINLSLRHGEILGLYGLVGAGRSELAKAIIGATRIRAGEVLRGGKAVRVADPSDAVHRLKIGYVSENRKDEGLILQHSVLDNAGITVWRRSATLGGLLSGRKIKRLTTPFLNRLEVKTPSLAQTVGNLSGGNQQKIAISKWLAAGVDVLIVDEPTVGIDVKSKAYFHQLLFDLAASGTAVLLITSDMPEMIALADRIAVMDGFAVQGEVANDRDYGRVSEAIMGLIHHQAEPQPAAVSG